MDKKTTKKNIFSRELKLEIIQKYLLENKTQTELGRENNINGLTCPDIGLQKSRKKWTRKKQKRR